MRFSLYLTFSLLALALLNSPVIAQTQRVEVPVRFSLDQLYMVPIGQQGIVVFNKTRQNVGKGLVEYIFRKYDTNLKENWSIRAVVKRNLPFIDYTFSSQTLYLLFGKYQSNTYQLIKVNAQAGFSEKIEFFFVDRLNIRHLAATDNDLYVGGQLQGEPALLHINLILKKTKILPLKFKGRTVIESVYLDTLNNFVNTTIVSAYKGETKVLLKSYLKGKEVRNVELPNEEKKYLRDAQVIATEKGEQLVIAPYSRYNERRAHQGIMVARITAKNKVRSPRFYSFNDLKNFYGHLSEREQKRIQRKILRRQKKGKKDYPVTSKILLHKISKDNNQYVVAGEIYLETVRVTGGAFFSPRRFPQQRLPREWDYSRTIALAFDKSGRLIWDNVIKLSRVKVPQIYPITIVKPKIGADSSQFLYYYNDMVYTKNFKENTKGGEIKETELQTSDKEDNVRENILVQVRRWYQDYYLLWGYQRVKNKRSGRRRVFFVQKMKFGD